MAAALGCPQGHNQVNILFVITDHLSGQAGTVVM